MKPIAILEHSPEAPAGFFGDAADRAGLELAVIRLHAGEPLPSLEEVSAIVSLGGVMGAYEEVDHAFLGPEKTLLREATESGMPVLGICLGCQMLADALGGSAYQAPQFELGFGPLQLTEVGADDGG